MMHRHLGEAVSGVLQFLDEFQTDRTAVGLQVDGIEDAPSDQAEITIDIAQFEAKQKLDRVVIDAPDDFAVQWIASVDLPAIDNIDVIAQRRQQRLKFTRVILRVSIGVEDQVFGAGSEPDAQGAAIPERLAVRVITKAVEPLRQFFQYLDRVVGAAIFHHDDFVVVGQLFQRPDRCDDQAADRATVVVRREEC